MTHSILVAGASGWLGQQIVTAIDRAGHPVRVLLRGGNRHSKAAVFMALDAEIARRKAAAPSDPTGWAGLQYHRLMARGSGLLNSPQNARYPAIEPQTIRGFMAALR